MIPYILRRATQIQTGWPSEDGEVVINQFLTDLPNQGPFFGWTHLIDLHSPIHPRIVSDGGFGPKSYLKNACC